MNTIDAAKHRWKEILPQFGVSQKLLSGTHQPCPFCGGKDRFRFTDPTGNGGYFCNQCGHGSGMQLLMRMKNWDFATAAREVDEVIGNLPDRKVVPLRDKLRVPTEIECARVWKSAALITPESAPGKYLAKRGLDFMVGYDKALRSTIATFHPHAQIFPVMVAKFCDTAGVGKQLHMTFLTEDGDKAPVEPNKKFMRGVLPKGGAIRLGEPAEAMGIAEGIETAMAAAEMFKMPVWAATSALMLECWEPPVGVKRIVIYGDNDASGTGQAAAWALYKKLWVQTRGECVIEVRTPETQGHDWNDELREMNDVRVAPA